MTATRLVRSAQVTVNGRLLLDTDGPSCESCVGCGGALARQRAPASLQQLRVNAAPLPAGSEVMIELAVDQLLVNALMGYGLPALLLAGGAFLGGLIYPVAGDFAAVCGGLGGLVVGSLLLRLYDSRSVSRPAVIRVH